MGHATISLEDDPSGAVACKLVFTGGFNNASGAHQAAQILIAQMDALMERKGNAVIDPLVVEARPVEQIEPGSGEAVVASLRALKQAAELQRG